MYHRPVLFPLIKTNQLRERLISLFYGYTALVGRVMYPVAVVGPRYGEVESSACDGCL